MKLGVALPSRGLVRAGMAEALDRELRRIEHRRYWSHDLALPECFNSTAARALAGGATHVLFVEEDVALPEGALAALVGTNADVAAIDYPLHWEAFETRAAARSSYRFRGELLWVSLGCTLVRREVFERLPYPWFVTDRAVAVCKPGSAEDVSFAVVPRDPASYGGQDQIFAWNARQAGFLLAAASGIECGHLPSITEGA